MSGPQGGHAQGLWQELSGSGHSVIGMQRHAGFPGRGSKDPSICQGWWEAALGWGGGGESPALLGI
jgi:hypothetical protein